MPSLIFYIQCLKRKDTNEPIYKSESASQTKREQTHGSGGVGKQGKG